MTAVTASNDKTVRLWNLAEDRDPNKPNQPAAEVLRIDHSEAATAVALSPDGKQMATADSTGTLRLFDRASGKSQAVLGAHGDTITALHFHPHSQRLLSSSIDGMVKLWNTQPVLSVALADDNRTIVSGSADKSARVETLSVNSLVVAGTHAIHDAKCLPDGLHCVTVDAENGAKL